MREQGYGEPTGQAKLTKSDCALLASCYRSCLELAAENCLESVTSIKKVIFNVFQEEDQAIYNRILRAGRKDAPSA